MSDPFACSFVCLKDLVPQTLVGFTALGQRLLPQGLEIRAARTMVVDRIGKQRLSRDCNAQILPGAGKAGAALLLYGGRPLSAHAPLSPKMQAHMIHELGHLAVPLDETSLGKDGLSAQAFRSIARYFRTDEEPVLMGRPWRRRLFYGEQAAVTFDSVVKALAGNASRRLDVYLKLKQIRQGRPPEDFADDSFDSKRDNGAVYLDIEPYADFSVYTPNPLARFYETEAGRNDARKRYIDAWGIAYERIAQDIDALPLFFRRHLRAMEIFAQAAEDLADRRGGRTDLAMKRWWRDVRMDTEAAGTTLPANPYACEPALYRNREEAAAAFENLQTSLIDASAARPGDKILRRVTRRFSKAMNDPTPPPRFVPALKAMDVSRTL